MQLSAAEYQTLRLQTRKAGLFNFIQAMGGHIDMSVLDEYAKPFLHKWQYCILTDLG